MNLASWQPTTLIDYPGRVAATFFFAGCNFRCPFCHNPELVLPELIGSLPRLDIDAVLQDLARRRGFLEGVVLTGGEPTLQADLTAFVDRVRRIGFLVKLDTNGSRPEEIEDLLDGRLVDYVAVDVKAPPDRYEEFAGVEVPIEFIERTIRALKDSRIDYEFRTTVAPGLAVSDLEAIAAWIAPAKRYVVQRFRVPEDKGRALVDPSWTARAGLTEAGLRRVWTSIGGRFENGGVRA